jgi:hypothetical protein
MTLATVHPYLTAAAVVAAVFFFARFMALRKWIKEVRAYKADRIYFFERKIEEQKNIVIALNRVGKSGEPFIEAERKYMRELQSKLDLAQTIPV